jgi:hypothetical protein
MDNRYLRQRLQELVYAVMITATFWVCRLLGWLGDSCP